MATSWKCFEDQNFLTFYLIQSLSRVGRQVGLRRGSRQKGWFSVTWGTGKWVVEDFFLFVCKIGFSIVKNFKKKKKCYKKKKDYLWEIDLKATYFEILLTKKTSSKVRFKCSVSFVNFLLSFWFGSSSKCF